MHKIVLKSQRGCGHVAVLDKTKNMTEVLYRNLSEWRYLKKEDEDRSITFSNSNPILRWTCHHSFLFFNGYKTELAAVLLHYFPLVCFWHLLSKK
jgi:hypothetical protein